MGVVDIEITVRPVGKGPERERWVEEEVRQAAYDCAEEVWWVPGLDAARALHEAMQTLASYAAYDSAMGILTALYDIVGMEMPERVAAIRGQPDLLEMFMGEFLAESEEFLEDLAAGEDEPADEDEDFFWAEDPGD